LSSSRERIPLEDGDVFLLGDIEVRFRDAAGPGRSTLSALDLAEEEEEPLPITHDLARPRGGARVEIQSGGGAGGGDEPEPEAEIELEGDWSDEPAPLPAAPRTRSAPIAEAPTAPPRTKGDDRATRQSAARAAVAGERIAGRECNNGPCSCQPGRNRVRGAVGGQRGLEHHVQAGGGA
jgi:hypothetical protein